VRGVGACAVRCCAQCVILVQLRILRSLWFSARESFDMSAWHAFRLHATQHDPVPLPHGTGTQVSPHVTCAPAHHTLLALPHPFIIAGDRFRECYHWDRCDRVCESQRHKPASSSKHRKCRGTSLLVLTGRLLHFHSDTRARRCCAVVIRAQLLGDPWAPCMRHAQHSSWHGAEHDPPGWMCHKANLPCCLNSVSVCCLHFSSR
jgi:hypothetical protein